MYVCMYVCMYVYMYINAKKFQEGKLGKRDCQFKELPTSENLKLQF